MEDSFKVRVDRAFGSLQASSPSPLSSLWCLTDEEIERNKWLQDKVNPHKDNDELIHRFKNPKPYSPFLQGLLSESSTSNQDLESDIQELDDDEDENLQQQLSKPEDHSNEEWDIRSSVGMDCTLDNEEEEDAYDEVAVGKEESADRFYMKDGDDYEVDIDSNNELPNSITDVIRDPRANHVAAKLRLKEDYESARKLGLQVLENSILIPYQGSKQHGSKAVPFLPQSCSSAPSKYTHYTFDSMNRKAYMEFSSSLKGSGAMEIQDDSPTTIVFTPRKKSSDASMKKSKVIGDEDKKVVPISIDEGCMMDEDEPGKSKSLQKSGRRYRTKGSSSVE